MPTNADQFADMPDAARLALFESVVEAIDQEVVVWSDDNLLIFCNKRFRDMWGYSDEDAAPGVAARDLLRNYLRQNPSAEKYTDAQLENEIELRFAIVTESDEVAKSTQFSHYDGRQLLIRRFEKPGLGRVSTYSDITPLKETENQLVKKTDILRSTLDAMDQGVAIWSDEHDEILELCNNRFLELWGYPEELGKPGTTAMQFLTYDAERGEFGAGDPQKLARKYLDRVRDYFDRETDDLHTTVDGKTLYIRRRVIEGFGSVSTFTDVSNLKKTEDDLRDSQAQLKYQIELLQNREAELEKQRSYLENLTVELDQARNVSVKMNQEKDRLFSILAHDLLGPFNAIIGFSSLLKLRAEHLDPPKIVEAADAINESATGLHQLLANLLEWSRTQMDGVVVDLSQVAVHEIAAEVQELFRASANQKNITIVDDIQTVTATTDSNMIAAVLRNLLSNAVKFTPEGGTIALSAALDGRDFILGVTDTGIGMPPDQLEKLFSLENLNTLNGTLGEIGTGLGLQVCKDFVETLGGTISIDSKPAEGTSFRVVLPVAGPDK